MLIPYNVVLDVSMNMPSFVTDSNNNDISSNDLTVTSVIQNEDDTFDIKVTTIYNYGFIIKGYSPSRYNFIVIKCSNGNEDENNVNSTNASFLLSNPIKRYDFTKLALKFTFINASSATA